MTVSDTHKWIRQGLLVDPFDQSCIVPNDYWELLGQDILNQMEYDYEKTQQTLDNYRPHWYLWRTLPLKWLLKRREDYQKWEYERDIIRLLRSIQRNGLIGTFCRLLRKMTVKLYLGITNWERNN